MYKGSRCLCPLNFSKSCSIRNRVQVLVDTLRCMQYTKFWLFSQDVNRTITMIERPRSSIDLHYPILPFLCFVDSRNFLLTKSAMPILANKVLRDVVRTFEGIFKNLVSAPMDYISNVIPGFDLSHYVFNSVFNFVVSAIAWWCSGGGSSISEDIPVFGFACRIVLVLCCGNRVGRPCFIDAFFVDGDGIQRSIYYVERYEILRQ